MRQRHAEHLGDRAGILSDGESYTFQPIYANGNTSCTSNVINSLVDSTTGSIRLVFTGTAGANPVVQRAIVVSFRMDSPLDFLWYTHFEAVDDGIPGYSECGVFYRDGRNSACNIVWISGDTMNGPAYTDDQFLINTSASPTFGRTPADDIESSAPGTTAADICSGDNCQNAVFQGTPVYNAKPIPTPSDNSELLTDAQNYGNVYSGTTSVQFNGTTATVVTCATSTVCTTSTVNLVQQPIIYVNNASGCTPAAYTPFGVTYPTTSSGNFYGCAGDVYVSGNYTTPVTIGAANNVIIDGNLTTTADGSGNPTGGATLGLVANEFVRLMHGINGSDSSSGCSTTNNASQTLTNPTVDAAIRRSTTRSSSTTTTAAPPPGPSPSTGRSPSTSAGPSASPAATGPRRTATSRTTTTTTASRTSCRRTCSTSRTRVGTSPARRSARRRVPAATPPRPASSRAGGRALAPRVPKDEITSSGPLEAHSGEWCNRQHGSLWSCSSRSESGSQSS